MHVSVIVSHNLGPIQMGYAKSKRNKFLKYFRQIQVLDFYISSQLLAMPLSHKGW